MGSSEEMQAYYAQGKEQDRLGAGLGRVEFARVTEVVSRSLPEPPATVADIGGGPGRYTDWLSERGHRVVHRDPVPLHVDQVSERHGDAIDTAVGDARHLDLADESADAVLLLGPLYHLASSDDRLRALAEAKRIVRPGGRIHASVISRWAPRLDGMLVKRGHTLFPRMSDMIDDVEATGVLPPVVESGFTGYVHRPDELRGEIRAAGLELEALVSVQGVAFALPDLDARMDDDADRALLLDTLRALEDVPELLGVGPHLLATARRPT